MARKVYGLHARDHMPGGADPLLIGAGEVLIFYNGSPQAITTGTPTRLEFDNAYDVTSDLWETAGNAAGANDPMVTTTEYLYPYKAGNYLVACHVMWETGSYAKRTALRMDGASGSGFAKQGLFSFGVAPSNDEQPYAEGFLTADPVSSGLDTHHRDWDVYFLEALTWRFYVEVEHTAGSDRDVLKAQLAVYRLAEHNGV